MNINTTLFKCLHDYTLNYKLIFLMYFNNVINKSISMNFSMYIIDFRKKI